MSTGAENTEKDFDDPLRNKKEWVKFNDDENTDHSGSTRRIDHDKINEKNLVEKTGKKLSDSPAIIEIPNNQISQLSTIDLPPRRDHDDGFGNGFFLLKFKFFNFN